MRVFVLLCLVAIVCADQLAYNYPAFGHSTNRVPSFVGSRVGSNISDSILNLTESLGGVNYAVGSKSDPHDKLQNNSEQSSKNAGFYAPQAELEKVFYSFTANNDDFTYSAASSPISNSLKQSLRVVFIKGPANNGLETAALDLAKQISKQKTDIYVFSKQTDLGSLANKLNIVNRNNNNKPEVYFVKYRTPEDAANIQKTIQDQYSSLGGSSQSHNTDIAPVLNFASQAPVISHTSDDSHATISIGLGTTSIGSLGTVSPESNSLNGTTVDDSTTSGTILGGPYVPPSSDDNVLTPGSSYLPASISHRLRF